jgi:YVTN family beta-propeller protein
VKARAALAIAALVLTVPAPALAQTPVGRAYVTAWGSDTVFAIDLPTSAVVATVPVGDFPRGVAVTPDGTRVYASNQIDDTVSVIDTATSTVVATVPVGDSPYGIRVNPSGSEVWVANSFAGGVSVINTATNTVTATVQASPFPHDVAFLPDGSRAYVSTQLGDVNTVDTSTKAVVSTVDIGHSLFGIEVVPDGSKVYVAHLQATDVAVLDTTSNALVATIPVGGHPQGLAVSPDGTKVYVADLSDGLWVIETATGEATNTDAVPGAADVAVSPDGNQVYVTGSAGVTVVDAATLAPVGTVLTNSQPETIAVIAERRPVIAGSTWYNTGAKARSGPAGSPVALYGVGAMPGLPYRLVLSRTQACADLVAFVNPTTVVPGASGLIGTVRGTIPAGTPAGTYWLCFRHTAGATATGVVSFTVS